MADVDPLKYSRNDLPNRLELRIVFRLELMFLLKTLYLQKVKKREKSDDVSVTDILES